MLREDKIMRRPRLSSQRKWRMTSHYVTSPAAYPGAREYHVTCSSPGIGGGTVWETEWRESTGEGRKPARRRHCLLYLYVPL